MSCPQCEGIELTFDEQSVDEELRFYHAEGAEETTLWLVDELKNRGVDEMSLLDIGGGIGAIQHELLESGVKFSTHVDASSAYIEASQREAKRRKLLGRIQWLHGDFVDLASSLQAADVVTLDKVICCYHDMAALVGASSGLAKRFYGIVVPRDVWWTRAGVRVMNFIQWLFRHPYRMFVHPAGEIDALVRKAGLKPAYKRHSWLWQVSLYSR
jgi:2-polyprenyl-3-methyl-5-hydroxy-6-metoxy-1,4-benzoquinol methylase